MKQIKLLLLLLMFGSTAAFGQIQQIKIVSFNVKNQLPGAVDTWGNVPGSVLLVAQMLPNQRVKGITLMVQIRAGGSIICSNNSTGGMQVDEFTTRTFSANELTGALPGCHELKDGSYSICVQFFNVDRVAISNEMCKEFTVETPKATDYAPPTLISPDNDKEYSEADLQRPVMFRWTPLVPKPREPVTYKLRVWQIMQGQTGTQTMRSTQPIITKDVDNLTQAVITGVITGPCKPPYLCEFIWNVQALNREGKPLGRNEGTSEPWTFKAKSSSAVTGPVNVSPEDKSTLGQGDPVHGVDIKLGFKWKAVEPKQPTPVTYKIRVWQLMSNQNHSQAMRSNKPLVEKDVTDLTELAVSGIVTGPCKPPYLCEFIWTVEASTRSATGATQKLGTSEPTVFMVSSCDVNLSLKLDSVRCISSANGFNVYRVCVTSTYTSPVYQLTYSNIGSGFAAYHPTYTPTYTISGLTPALQIQNTGPTTTVSYCMNITVPVGQNTIKLGLQGDDKDPGPIVCQPGAELDITLPPCACDACDEKNFNLKAPPPGNINISNNTISFNQSVSINAPGKTVSAVTADLVYFEMVPENDMCIPCNKDASTYGHFSNGTNTYDLPKPLPQQVNISITTPQLTPCCSAVFRWCIRYKVEMKDSKGECYVCHVLVCYEKKKEGCEKTENPNNIKK